jgi:hypothetical protein
VKHWGTALLFVLALARMTGEVFGLRWLAAAAAATSASPAPKVFCAVRGLETFSTRFQLEWDEPCGGTRSLAITPEVAARLQGPYNRRNVYGAVLAYGPVLATDERTRPMLEAVLRHALCPPYRLLAELGIDPADVAGAPRLRYEPLRAGALSGLPTLIAPDCP